ncbi:MAG: SprB repeat-containing protein [Bacteroidetes bacterium]|nr:SprB repeat-containing protein [Bacteroidota bacterium]
MAGTGLLSYTVNGLPQTSPCNGKPVFILLLPQISMVVLTSSIQTINEPTPVVLTASATNALCNAANGSLTFSATGGTGLFTFTVNGNTQTSPFATVAGTYTIVATDINGCTTSSIQTINEPTPLVLTASATNALCNAANGSLTFSANRRNRPIYLYGEWQYTNITFCNGSRYLYHCCHRHQWLYYFFYSNH